MKKGQFSRDWSLLKLARTWEPLDIGGEVIERMLLEGSPEAEVEILQVIRDIGFRDGTKAKERMPPFMQPAEIIESTLLVAGVDTAREEGQEGKNGEKGKEGDDRLVIMVNLTETGLFRYPFTMVEPAVAYVTGYVQAIAGDARIAHREDHLRILF